MQPTPAALLQFGPFPDGAEALTLALALLTFVVPAFLALWVLIDAKEQTDHPLAWGMTVLLGGLTPFYVGAIAVTVLYHLSREELGSIAPPSVTNETVDRGEVLGSPAREDAHAGPATRTDGSPPAPHHDELHGGDTVTGMGPDGQARWEGRADAGFGVDDRCDSDEMEEPDAGYDDGTSMGEGEWSEGTARADGDTTAPEPETNGEEANQGEANREGANATRNGESDPPDVGGFEMADPVEETGDETATQE